MKKISKHIRALWMQLYAGMRCRRLFVSTYTLIAVAIICASVVGVHTWSMVRLSQRVVTEAESAANRKIANTFADRLRSIGEKGSSADINRQLEELASLNPSVRLYIVDRRGIVKRSPAQYGRVILPFVDPKPLVQAVARDERTVAIIGDDPHNISAQEPISAAAIRLRGSVEYLYVVLSPRVAIVQSASSVGLQQGAISAVVVFAGGLVALALLLGGVHAYHAAVSSHIAAISHDLRSPLSAIQGHLETLIERGDRLSATERARFVSVALKSTRSATDLIDDVHYLSKIEATNTHIPREPFSATDLIMDVAMAVTQKCAAKKISLDVDVPPALPLCFGSVQLLERLTRNLIENALRYTPEGGFIRVAITNSAGAVRVTVLDSGVGIPKSELDRVTETFFRGATASSVAHGSGLGLSIASKIARLHGSELKIVSQESEGTAVIFTIPVYVKAARSA